MRQPINDDDTPRDLDDLMQRLRRRIGIVDRRAMHCASRRCRRARHCAGAAMTCAAPVSSMNAHQTAEMVTQLQTAIRDELRDGYDHASDDSA